MTKHIKVSGLSRREVLVGSAAGAGLVIGYSVLPNAVMVLLKQLRQVIGIINNFINGCRW